MNTSSIIGAGDVAGRCDRRAGLAFHVDTGDIACTTRSDGKELEHSR